MTAIRVEHHGGVRRLILARGYEHNTITPELRDELGDALTSAGRDESVTVVLAEGPAFCAGFGLDWSTIHQAEGNSVARHTQEGFDFMARAQEVGWRQTVREREEPFGDYGSRPAD